MSRAHRFLCILVLIPILLLIVLLAYLILRDTRTDMTRIKITIVTLVILAAMPGVPLLMYRFSEASRRRLQLDLLQEKLQITQVAELRGVQWTLLAFPDRIAAPGVAVITFLVQNAHAKPRVMTVSLLKNPFKVGGGSTVRQTLEGGEAGLIRFPLLVASPGRPARHDLEFNVEVRRTAGVGARVIARDGLHPRRLAFSRRTELEVMGSHTGPTVNEGALGWTSYQRLYITGQPAPDLEPVRLLESL